MRWLPNVLLIVSAFTLHVTVVLAEGPSEFYKQGYARTPMDSDKAVKQSKPKLDSKNPTPAVVNQPSDSKKPEFKKPVFKLPNVMDEAEGTPILSIGVIVDLNDREHYEQVMSGLRETLDRTSILAGTVYTLSAGGPYMEDNFIHLYARGASLQSGTELPERYQHIALSPTYIVETNEGEILLEAVSELNRFVNARGEFLEDPNPLKGREKPKGGSF